MKHIFADILTLMILLAPIFAFLILFTKRERRRQRFNRMHRQQAGRHDDYMCYLDDTRQF